MAADSFGDEDLPWEVDEYETRPRVVSQFLELCYRHDVDALTYAQVYHAGKGAIDSADIKLAIQSKVNFSFSQPPPREVLLELAHNRNKIQLPKSLAPGIPLPPELDTLIDLNYQHAVQKRQPEQAVEDEGIADPNSNP